MTIRIAFIILSSLSPLIIYLLISYSKTPHLRKRQIQRLQKRQKIEEQLGSSKQNIKDESCIQIQKIEPLSELLWVHIQEATEDIEGSTIKEKLRYDKFREIADILIKRGWKKGPDLSLEEELEAQLINASLIGEALREYRARNPKWKLVGELVDDAWPAFYRNGDAGDIKRPLLVDLSSVAVESF